MSQKELYDLGELPPLGFVPAKMHAQVIREERFGEPSKSIQPEAMDVPAIGDDDALVYVMAAGVNYNNVWAALGVPVNVIAARRKEAEKAGRPFADNHQIGGSDLSGIVWKVGKNVTNVKVGDEVVAHCGEWDMNDPWVKAGKDPMLAPTQKIWGYETTWGSFAQFAKVQGHALLPKPKHLSWAAASAYMLVGATAYRMLYGWAGNTLSKDDVVLIWGGAGGLGSMAIQICAAAGAKSVAVVSSADKIEYCKKLGATGVLNRNDFNHWGMQPHWKDKDAYGAWVKGAQLFGSKFWEALGEKRNPTIVFEHPGESTLPTSMYVAEKGGMVVICAGTSGFNISGDLRYHWMRQKRLQGSHFANDDQAKGVNDLVIANKVDPCLARTFQFAETGLSHQLMYENKHPHGNMAILVNAKTAEQKDT